MQRTLDNLSKKVVEEHTKLVSDMQRVTEKTSKQISLFINKQHHPGMFNSTRDAKSPDMMTQESLTNFGAGLQNTTQDHSTASKAYATQKAIDDANSMIRQEMSNTQSPHFMVEAPSPARLYQNEVNKVGDAVKLVHFNNLTMKYSQNSPTPADQHFDLGENSPPHGVNFTSA